MFSTLYRIVVGEKENGIDEWRIGQRRTEAEALRAVRLLEYAHPNNVYRIYKVNLFRSKVQVYPKIGA